MSIKAEDLRVGNWVRIVGETSPYQWTVEDFDLLNDEFPIHPEPIPLTPEILIDCGFKNRLIDEVCECWYFGVNPLTHDWLIHIQNNGEGYFYRNAFYKIKYLHQLQNLYYSLTGAEIIYNPK